MSYRWNEIIEEFLADIQIKSYSKVTIYNYRYKLKNIADYFISQNISIDNVKRLDIKRWILFLQDEGKQASTINVTINRLSRIFNYMVDEEYIEDNPFDKIKRMPIQKKLIYPLNDFEIKQLLAETRKHPYKHIAQRNTVILMLMLDCGLRISEVVNLKNVDILEHQLIVKNSKYNKDRAVAISPILEKEIIKYNRIKKKKYGKNNCDYFIISNKGGKLNEKAIWQLLQAVKDKISIRDVVRFSGHTLRHTYAYMQMRNGMDIYTLSLNMGHSSVAMTQKYLQTLKSDDFVEKSVKYSTLMNLK